MNLEEKFLEYFQDKNVRVNMWVDGDGYIAKKEVAHDLALIAQEGREVIIEGGGRLMAYSGKEMFLEYEKGCVHFFNNKNLYKHKGKKVKIILEVQE